MSQLTAMNRRDRRRLAARSPKGGNSAELATQYEAMSVHVGTIVGRMAVGRRAQERLERRLYALNRRLGQRWRFWQLKSSLRERYRQTARALGELAYNIRRDEAELKSFMADMVRLNEQGHAAMEREKMAPRPQVAPAPPAPAGEKEAPCAT